MSLEITTTIMQQLLDTVQANRGWVSVENVPHELNEQLSDKNDIQKLEFVNNLAALLWCKYSECLPQQITATELPNGQYSFKIDQTIF